MVGILLRFLRNSTRAQNAGKVWHGVNPGVGGGRCWIRNYSLACQPVRMTDDITALISGFGQFKLIRRRLSVISDDSEGGRFGHVAAKTKLENLPLDLVQRTKNVIALKDKGSKVSGVVVETAVMNLCEQYNDAEPEDKAKFLTALASRFGVHVGEVNQTASSLLSCNEDSVRLKLLEELRYALLPDYHWLFLQVAKLENGVKFLVDMRSDLIDLVRKEKSDHSLIMNEHLRDLLALWFSVAFLSLERITWQSSQDMLQKITEYEAVHPMKGLTDLRQRVGPYRRCFVFTHPCMPGEPMVVLHTALLNTIPSKIADIVRAQENEIASDSQDFKEEPSKCDTAIFYSITSTQKGLLGIELGNLLIKRVVKEVKNEFPGLKRFSSLSPIPGFKNWTLSSFRKGSDILNEEEWVTVSKIFNCSERSSAREALVTCLTSNQYMESENLKSALESILMRLCAVYLVETKRNGYALDPVAHFHLKNGAVVWRLNYLGDLSQKGLNQSFGIMVNYRYYLEDCDKNSQSYVEDQLIRTSESVQMLLSC